MDIESKEAQTIQIPNEKAVYVKEYNLAEELDRKMYSDQTGKFPVTSYKGNQYIMVLFETTSNNILVEAMKDRTAGEMVRAYQFLIDRLKKKESVLPNISSTTSARQNSKKPSNQIR